MYLGIILFILFCSRHERSKNHVLDQYNFVSIVYLARIIFYEQSRISSRYGKSMTYKCCMASTTCLILSTICYLDDIDSWCMEQIKRMVICRNWMYLYLSFLGTYFYRWISKSYDICTIGNICCIAYFIPCMAQDFESETSIYLTFLLYLS